MEKRHWSDLSPREQTIVLTLVSVELALTATALVDLARRPEEEVKGRKLWWALGCFVQPVGPVAYLTLGVRR